MQLRQRKALLDDEVEAAPQRHLLRAFAQADMFTKPKEDFRRQQTPTGAALSAATAAVILLLVLWEVGAYLVGRDAYHTELAVDAGLSRGVPFNIDITFFSIPCHHLSVDAMDAAGGQENNVVHDLFKSPVDHHGRTVFHGRYNYVERRLGPDGHPVGPSEVDETKDPRSPNFCGNCYITPNTHHHGYDRPGGLLDSHLSTAHKKACCNTCEQVMAMYDMHRVPRPHVNEVEQCITELSHANPGCNLRGTLHLRKVKGNFHFAPGESIAWGPFGQHVHQFGFQELMSFNISHRINELSIGDARIERFNSRGAVKQPLDGATFATGRRELAHMKYYLSIVPTTYTVGQPSKTAPVEGEEFASAELSYEYSVQRHHNEFPPGSLGRTPSLFFVFDFHPIQVNNYFYRPPLTMVLVRLCGIVGGLFVVLGLVDRTVEAVCRRAI